MSFLSRLFRRKPTIRESVSFDETEVIRTLADGRRETLRWDDLQEVSVITTDEGPFADDLYWALLGNEGGCAVPSTAAGADALLSRLQQLPGFKNEIVVEAMGSTANAKFVCWERAT
jgi:hypothetical protein